jgi:hypothetical protein
VLIGVGIGAGSAIVVGALIFVEVAKNSPSKDQDPRATARKLRTTLICLGAASVGVGTKFGIDAARGKGSTTVMTIRIIPEPE